MTTRETTSALPTRRGIFFGVPPGEVPAVMIPSGQKRWNPRPRRCTWENPAGNPCDGDGIQGLTVFCFD
jgi:hypothetical protein